MTPQVQAFVTAARIAAYQGWFSANKCGVCPWCGDTFLGCEHEEDDCGCTEHASDCQLGPLIAAYWNMSESDDPETKAFVREFVYSKGAGSCHSGD